MKIISDFKRLEQQSYIHLEPNKKIVTLLYVYSYIHIKNVDVE